MESRKNEMEGEDTPRFAEVANGTLYRETNWISKRVGWDL